MSYVKKNKGQASQFNQQGGGKVQVVFEAPGRDTPGFLKRMDQALMFQEVMSSGLMTREVVANMIDFLADFITEPGDREQVKEILREASQNDFDRMMSLLSGQNNQAQETNQKNGKKPDAGLTE